MLLPSLLSVAAAGDLPVPDTGLVADVGIMVEMAPLRVVGSVLGTGIWSGVPDAMAVEIALTTHHIPTEDASLLSASTSIDSGGVPRVRLTWVDLGDGTERMAVERKGSGKLCTNRSQASFWSGGHEVMVYAPSSAWAAENQSAPAFVIVDDNPRIGAMVSLAPGESVTVRGLRKDGLLWRETVRVDRKLGALILDREGGLEQLCYEAPEQPVE